MINSACGVSDLGPRFRLYIQILAAIKRIFWQKLKEVTQYLVTSLSGYETSSEDFLN